MISVIIGLMMGVGFLFIWVSFWQETQNKPLKVRKTSSLQTMLRQADLEKVSVKLFFAMSLVAALFLTIIAFALTGIVPLAIICGVIGIFLPRTVIRYRAKRRQTVLRDLWPDAVDHLRSAIRAGMSLPEALMQLQHRGPEPLRPAFAAFASDYRASGEFVPALERLKTRLSDPTADNIIEALKVTREVGGTDLGRLLGTLSMFLRENTRTRSELEARQSWTVNAARLASVAPWIVLGLMATQPSTLKIYNSVAGFVVLSGGLLITIFAYRLMMRIGSLPEEKRVLA